MKDRYCNAFLFTLLLLFLPEYSIASGNHTWKFDSEKDLNGWSGQGGQFSFVKQESLVRIEGGIRPVFISPTGLNLFINNAYFLKIRLRSSVAANLKGFILFRPKGSPNFFSKSFLSFNIKHSGEFHDYMVNFKDFFAPETILEQFAIVFTGGNIIEIDSVEIYELSFIESAWHKIKQGFLAEEVIRGATINTVTTPLVGSITFPVFLYGIALIISIGIILFRRRWTMNEIRKAVIISLVFSGFIFAFKMDYNWLIMMKKDIKVFSGMDVRQRINTLFGDDLYDFATIAKKIIPSDKKARKGLSGEIGEGYFGIRLYRYYLPPIKTSKDGGYVLVYMDKSFAFDPITRTLSKDGKAIASPVEMVYNHNNYGFIYRIIK